MICDLVKNLCAQNSFTFPKNLINIFLLHDLKIQFEYLSSR